MNSLRAKLILGTAIGTTTVLLVSGSLLYALISATLRTEFDEALAAKARSLAALTEESEDGLEFEPTEVSLPEFAAGARAEYYQLWRHDGTVFARSPSLGQENLDRLEGTSGAAIFRTVRLPDGRTGRLAGLTFVPRQEYEKGSGHQPATVTLVLGRETAGLQETLARVRAILVSIWLVSVVLSGAVLAWVVRQGLRPVDRLSRQIGEVGECDLARRIDVADAPRELLPVIDRLNDLLARLDAAFQRERRFTGDVAHELRTPLAGLRAKLELALSRDRESEAYRGAMNDCLEISLQMQCMVETLLHLVRADAGQLEVRREPVDLSALVRECWRPLQGKSEARQLRLEWRLDGIGQVETDRDTLRLAIQNILDNAVTYANEEGIVTVAAANEEGTVRLVVSNTGCTLSREDVGHVFDRFWRGGATSVLKGKAHCGLGLSLCQAMISRLGGSIRATISDECVFSIVLRIPGS